MKYYETNFQEYVQAVDKYNLHSELEPIFKKIPITLMQMGNYIFYGPSGVGKYSQVLRMLVNYSPSKLKYDKKIVAETDKQKYNYRISDIHYEIDMSILGCNSKTVWHEVFFQIIDIISTKQNKFGFILCKNFHSIQNELLETFYSYIQHYNYPDSQIQIRFILLTEQISFLPETILNFCQIISVNRPSIESYKNILLPPSVSYSEKIQNNSQLMNNKYPVIGELNNQNCKSEKTESERRDYEHFMKKINNINSRFISKTVETIEGENIVNIKELFSFHLIKNDKIPKDFFNIICDNAIKEMENPDKIVFTTFRDVIYDMLIYNLDITECVWYILQYFIHQDKIKKEDCSPLLEKIYIFLTYYNNNYRPIYHLESIFYYFIIKIHGYSEYEP